MSTHLNHDSTVAGFPTSAGLFNRQRPRLRAWGAAAGCFVSIALTGCSWSSDTPHTSVGARPGAESAQSSSAAADELHSGTCWGLPTASVTDLRHRFDNSPHVPFKDPHTTGSVTPNCLAEPTIEVAQRFLQHYWDDVRVILYR